MKLKLVLPSAEYKDSYLKALKEYQKEGRYLDFNLDKLKADFSVFVELLKGFAKGLNLPEGFIPETKYWLVEDILGMILGRQSGEKGMEKLF